MSRAVAIACGAALLLFVAGRCLVPMDETDLFFNLRLGEIVLHDHVVPRTNLLSFTQPDARDVNLAWLFQIVLALAHRAGGIPGTLLLKTAFVLATVAVLFRVALRRGAHPAAAALALALSAWAAEPRFVERPHLVTFLGLALTLLALERAESGRPRALYVLVPCGLVWANANSCFFLAPLVLALYALGARLDGRSADARRAACAPPPSYPLMFATPSGVHALGYIANHWRMPWLRPLQEYVPARWPANAPAAFVAAGVILASILPSPPLASPATGRAARPRRRAPQPLHRRVRAAVRADRRARADRRRRGRDGASDRRRPRGPSAASRPWPASRCSPAPRSCRASRRRARRPGGRHRPGSGAHPHGGDRLRHRQWPSRPDVQRPRGRLLPHLGRLATAPRVPGPAHQRLPARLPRVAEADDLSRREWDAVLAGFGVTTALVTYPDLNPRAAFFDPERWALVYRAADGLVFVARRPEFAALAARAEIPVTFAFTRATGVEPRALDARPAGSPVTDCEWQRRLGDFFAESHEDLLALNAYRNARATPGCLDGPALLLTRMALGDAALRLRDPATAAEAYAGIELPRAHSNRALALLALGRAQEALDEARRAQALDPRDPGAHVAERLARERLARPSQ